MEVKRGTIVRSLAGHDKGDFQVIIDFNDEYVKLAKGIAVPYWQSAQDPQLLMATNEDDDDIIINNIVAFVHDVDALGTYRKEEEALTTPVNSVGRYYNTDWHVDNLYFNDMSENGVYFTLD